MINIHRYNCNRYNCKSSLIEDSSVKLQDLIFHSLPITSKAQVKFQVTKISQIYELPKLDENVPSIRTRSTNRDSPFVIITTPCTQPPVTGNGTDNSHSPFSRDSIIDLTEGSTGGRTIRRAETMPLSCQANTIYHALVGDV